VGAKPYQFKNAFSKTCQTEGITQDLLTNEDETKKLQGAVTITHRQKKPLKAECLVFAPEESERLCMQVPDAISNQFKYEELAGAAVAVPYDKERLMQLEHDDAVFVGSL
jgi:hypothetical protein